MSTLQPGSNIGPYHILGALGAGGMGIVYRARDTKLGREVALKVLPGEFALDGDRLSRFQREAQVLASLNHPHIGQIYGLEESSGSPCLVLELVEGDTLQDRLKRGPVPQEQALNMALQIAEGIEAAHQRGIIHRDLKPSNIKLTPEGNIKVLDFGLAKVFEPEPAATNLSQSPTALTGRTAPNVILGTLLYMSPEQVRGGTADDRSDIWAFGCVLYELLTGRAPFHGESTADVIGAITKTEPDWSALPQTTPARIQTLLRRCLAKDRTRRLHHIADARIEITESDPIPQESARPTRTTARSLLAAIAVSLVLGGAATFSATWYLRETPPPELEMRLEITTPPTSSLALALSPDGQSVVFEAVSQGKSQLWLRRLDSSTSRPIPGTENATFPFWSPDSQTLAFFAGQKLKRVDVNGGLLQTVADISQSRGAAWGPDGTILLCVGTSGALFRLSANSPVPVPVTQLEKDQGSHRYPQFLPDGRHFIFFALGKPEATGIYVGSLESMESKRILTTDSQALYVQPGFLLFPSKGTLVAQRFDATKLELQGESFPLAGQVGSYSSYTGAAAFSSATTGMVAYRTNTSADSQMAWFDRTGNETGKLGPVGTWTNVQLSSDTKQVVAQRSMDGNLDIWAIEVARGLTRRVTTGPADDEYPMWSLDGSGIIFDSSRKGSFDIYNTPSNGAGGETPILESPDTKLPTSLSSDGRYLLYVSVNAKTAGDLWVLPLFGKRVPFPFVVLDSAQNNGVFSPDVRWIAYESDESGQKEVYVEAFPNRGEKVQISANGGSEPQWRGDGKELFYLAADGNLMAVTTSASTEGKKINAVNPAPLFRTPLITTFQRRQYSVTPDGQRFLLVVPVESTPSPISILLNWANR